MIRYIYQEYARGIYVPNIIAALSEQGIFFHGKPFTKNFLYHLLQNEKYTGIYRLHGAVYENVYPRIISDELWEKVREIRKKNHFGKRSVTTIYLLRGKLICGYCGQSINAETGTARNGKVMHYYKCRGRKNRLGCHKETVAQETLEDLILDAVTEQLQQPKSMATLIDGVLKAQADARESNAALKQLYYEKKKAETALQNIMAAVEKGVVTETTAKRMLEVEAALHDLTQKIACEKSKAPVLLSREDITRFYAKALRMEPALLIHYLIRQIVLFDDKAEIYYNTPTDTTPGDGRGFSFLRHGKTIRSIPRTRFCCPKTGGWRFRLVFERNERNRKSTLPPRQKKKSKSFPAGVRGRMVCRRPKKAPPAGYLGRWRVCDSARKRDLTRA